MNNDDNSAVKKYSSNLLKINNQIAISNRIIAESKDKLAQKYANKALKLQGKGKDYKTAIEYYTEAIKIKPDLVICYFRRSYCKNCLKDYKGQLNDFSLYLEFEPTSENYLSRALIKMKLEDHQGVISDCTTAIDLGYSDSHAYKYRGLAYSALNNFDESIKNYNRALYIAMKRCLSAQRNPNYGNKYYEMLISNIFYNRAHAKKEVKNFKGSLEDLNKVLALYPTYSPNAYKLRAEVKYEIGDLTGYNIDMYLYGKKSEALKKRLKQNK